MSKFFSFYFFLFLSLDFSFVVSFSVRTFRSVVVVASNWWNGKNRFNHSTEQTKMLRRRRGRKKQIKLSEMSETGKTKLTFCVEMVSSHNFFFHVSHQSKFNSGLVMLRPSSLSSSNCARFPLFSCSSFSYLIPAKHFVASTSKTERPTKSTNFRLMNFLPHSSRIPKCLLSHAR